jgi:hypothetical protein
MLTHIWRCIAFSVSILLVVFFVFSVAGNPIPVYPDPKPVMQGFNTVDGYNIYWIVLVFIVDFFLNLLILYGAVYLLDRYNLLDTPWITGFKTKKLLLGAFIVSLIGLFSEVLLGIWIGGLLMVLILVLLSFSLVSRYLFEFRWVNCLRIGLIAITVNIVVWLIVFSV